VDENAQLERDIQDKYRMTPDEAERVKKCTKDSVYTHARLKLMAVSLELPKTKSEAQLIDMVQEAVARLRPSSTAKASRVTTNVFRRNIHTFPRLCL
jgi:hypothetical protein